MSLELSGEGVLVISTEEGVWNETLGPEQTLVEARHASDRSDELHVELAGWWRGRVRIVGALTPGSGPLFQMARRGSSDDELYVPRRGAIVALTILTVDGEMILLQDDFTGGHLRLSEEPASTRLHVESGADQDDPQFLKLCVTEVAGISVNDSMLTSALGDVVQFGNEITFRNAATIALTVEGIAAHGGTCWRTDPLRLTAGSFETTLTLREIP